jgi:hypothetical protein
MNPPPIPAPIRRRANFLYQFVDNFGAKKLPTSVTTKINGVQVSRSDFIYTYESVADNSSSYPSPFTSAMPVRVMERRDYYNSSAFLTTVTRTYREDADPLYRFLTGLPYSVERPDGTMTVMAYGRASSDTFDTAPYAPSTSGTSRIHIALTGTSDSASGTLMPGYTGAQALPANFRAHADER